MIKKIISALAIVAASFTAQADDLIIATGGEGGGYERLGYYIKQNIDQQSDRYKVDFDTELMNTNGSVENIELLSDGTAKIAIVQADALSVMPPKVPFRAKSAYTEYGFWLFNKDHGIEDLSDIEGSKEYAIAIVEGSGSEVMLRSFVQEDNGYKPNLENAVFAMDNYDAADIVSEGRYQGKKVAGMIYIGSKVPSEIARDFGNIRIGEMTDSDFNDAKDVNGDSLYESCDIESNRTSGLKTSTTLNPDTVCVKAMVVYADTFADRKEVRAIKKGINKSVRGYK